MALKTKINSLRCQKWYGFAKQKMALLQEASIPFKAYIIDGYHIYLKALINLAIIKAPPGLAIFRKGRDKNGKPAVVINYADMYGNGKEKTVEIPSLRGASDGEPPINPLDTGWPGNILPLATGGFDFINLFFGGRPDTSVDTPSYFTGISSSIGLQALAAAPYSIRYKRGFVNVKAGSTSPTIFSAVNIDNKHYFTISAESQLFDAAFNELYFGLGENKPYGFLAYANQPLTEIKDRWEDPDNKWDFAWLAYTYSWKNFNALKDRDVLRTCWVIQGGWTGFQRAGIVFFFTEFEVFDDYSYDFAFMGETFSQQVYALYPYSEYTKHESIAGIAFAGAPATQPTQATKIKTLVFPISGGELAFMQWNHPKAINPSIPIQLVVNQSNTPYLHAGFFVPFVYNMDDTEKDYKNPFCVRVSEYPLPALYLYWEEWMLYGGEETDIKNFKYGTPLVAAGWIDFPFFDEGWRLANFMPIKVTWEHRIILAVIYYEADPQDGGGMYTALLDTEKSANWTMGSRFSETRLDRCSPTIFGEHPYVFERMKYSGTQWGWDYSYCENYAEPPEGYP